MKAFIIATVLLFVALPVATFGMWMYTKKDNETAGSWFKEHLTRVAMLWLSIFVVYAVGAVVLIYV